MSENQEHF